MANGQNLKPWNPGTSGNPKGKPKGAKHLSTWIQELLVDESFEAYLIDSKHGLREYKGAPIKAILITLIHKSVNGDLKAFDLLAKYGYGTRIDITSKDEQVVIPILAGMSKARN